jgi:HK97 gp10 family phage protein
MSVTVNLDGLHRIERELPQKIADELNDAASAMADLARQLAPVKTGFMHDHISQKEEASAAHLRSTVESEADYSLYVEYGTVNMDAQPFFTPAFESAKRQLGKVKL